VVEDARTKVRDDAAHVVHRRVDQAAHAQALAVQVGTAVHPACEPVHVHLQRHQQRAQLVVDLACDAGALVLAHRFQMSCQIAQLRGALGHAMLQLVLAALQELLRPLALADVDEGHHGTLHGAVRDHRVARILGPEPAAVGAPEHLVVDAARQATAEGIEDRAVDLGVRTTVAMCVVDQVVHVTAEHLVGAPAQHLCGRPVDEGASSVQIDAEDALSRALQQQGQSVGRIGGHARQRAIGVPEANPRFSAGPSATPSTSLCSSFG
jgi:hypothetical protein